MTTTPFFGRKNVAVEERAPHARVSDAMTTRIVTATPEESVSSVSERARQRGVHHVVVTHTSGELAGIICACDMESSWPDASVGECMSVCPMFTAPWDSLSSAAETMARYGIGALPVLALGMGPVGIITRSDLRAKGALPDEPGVDRCASCGGTHLLCPSGVNDICFCRTCKQSVRQSEEEIVLGVGD